MITDVDIPCCQECHDWMQAVMLIEYPVTAVVWACVNGHSTVFHGLALPEDIPEPGDAAAISMIANSLRGRNQDADDWS